jgi:hypothetical protein
MYFAGLNSVIAISSSPSSIFSLVFDNSRMLALLRLDFLLASTHGRDDIAQF